VRGSPSISQGSPVPADDSPAPADGRPAPADGLPAPASQEKSPASRPPVFQCHPPGPASHKPVAAQPEKRPAAVKIIVCCREFLFLDCGTLLRSARLSVNYRTFLGESFMKNIALSFALLLACLSIPASAGNLNVGTLRGTVVDNTPDCYTCSPDPHGCFINLNTSGDPVTIHLGLDTGDDCTSLVADDCIEVTGEVVNGLVAIPAVGSYQLDATMWRRVDLCD
jgi:hypothetical protein